MTCDVEHFFHMLICCLCIFFWWDVCSDLCLIFYSGCCLINIYICIYIFHSMKDVLWSLLTGSWAIWFWYIFHVNIYDSKQINPEICSTGLEEGLTFINRILVKGQKVSDQLGVQLSVKLLNVQTLQESTVSSVIELIPENHCYAESFSKTTGLMGILWLWHNTKNLIQWPIKK